MTTIRQASFREGGVIVIGAGVAGLAAAGHLRAHGISTTLIEATSRIGGRARTELIGHDPFDHGATWLHDADRNPLVALAGPDDDLIDTDRHRRERVTIAGRLATVTEQADYDESWERLDCVVAPALASPDITLAAAMAGMADDPWMGLVALWEGAIIAAADASRLGLQDWHRNRLGGRNLVPRAGVGAFVGRRLHTEAILDTPAHRICWGGPDVSVETPTGTIRAAAVIITVSTGVLAAGSIRFDPPLPAPIEGSIHALPMGLLTKVAVPAATGSDRLGLEPGTVLVDRDGCMTFNAWPLDRDYLTGFIGGDRAWSLARDPDALADLARAELRRALGGGAVLDLLPAIITDWGANPAFAGAYAYAGPGDADHRGALAAAFPAERVVFAGEATRTDGLAGTVGGAYLSGIEAARRLLV